MSIETAIASIGPNSAVMAYPLETAMIKGGFVYALDKAHFIAHLIHESNMRVREENLNYSLKNLRKTFGKYFKTDEEAQPYVFNPQKLANRVYGGRMENTAPGDGWKYRGRGLIQLTGKSNYRRASSALFNDLRLVENPDLALDRDTACRIAVWYWNNSGSENARGEWKSAREWALLDDLIQTTKAVNGGLNGLDDRKKWLRVTKTVFGVI